MTVEFHSLTTTMRYRANGFRQEQACVWCSGKEPSAPRFTNQVFVVFKRFGTKQRESKSVLPSKLAVTSTTIATKLGKDRYDLVGEIDRFFGSRKLNFNRYLCRHVSIGNGSHRQSASCDRRDQTCRVDSDQPRLRHFKSDIAS